MESIDLAFKVLDLFIDNNTEAYLVGGSVRDYLLFNDFSDFDFASPCQPSSILNILDTYEYDKFSLKFGTVKTKFEGQIIEITTFRKEGEYLDYRHPSNIKFIKDIKIDSLRRDFTINALYMDYEGNIHDFHNGLKDLENQTIRMIGDCESRIKEDPVRILRAIRFACKLSFKIEENLLLSIKNNTHLLSKISSSRIEMEISKLKEFMSDEQIDNLLKEYGIYQYCYNK